MPSVSGAQHRFMAMARTPEGRAKLRASGHKNLPTPVQAGEFVHADKGRRFANVGRRSHVNRGAGS